MNRVLLHAFVMAASAGLAGAGPQQTPAFRTGTQTVAVYTTVIGADGRLVTGLGQDAFDVLDNGRPQPITIFDNGVQPITIVVMLDVSGSMLGNLSTLRSAAVQMFTRLLPADRATVGSFGDRITVSDRFTNDEDTLIRALWLDLQPGGATPLWAAVNVAMTTLRPMDGRRVVLVLSDGHDTGFRRGNMRTGPRLEDVVERARNGDFMVYAIGMRSRGEPGRMGRGPRLSFDAPDPGLGLIAAESGGGYFELTGTEELGPVFARVADELHRQYLIGYAAPEADGAVHTIEVRVHDPRLTARARRSYVAPRSKSQPPAAAEEPRR